MAVNYIPSGFEGLQQVLMQLGAVAGEARYGQEIAGQARRDATLQNPNALSQLALALEANPELDLSAFGGVRPGDVEALRAGTQVFAPTLEQRVGRQRADSPSDVASVVGAEREETTARTKVAKAAGAEATFAEQFANARVTEDIPALNAQLEAMQARLGVDQVNLMRGQIDEYIKLLPTLSPHMRAAAISAMVNPRFLAHVEHHESIDAQWAMLREQMRNQSGREMDPMALLKFRLDLAKEQSTAVQELLAANQLKGPDRDSARSAALARINGISMMHQEAYPGEPFILGGQRPVPGIWNGLKSLFGTPTQEGFIEYIDSVGTDADMLVSRMATGRITATQLRTDTLLRQQYPWLNDGLITSLDQQARRLREDPQFSAMGTGPATRTTTSSSGGRQRNEAAAARQQQTPGIQTVAETGVAVAGGVQDVLRARQGRELAQAQRRLAELRASTDPRATSRIPEVEAEVRRLETALGVGGTR